MKQCILWWLCNMLVVRGTTGNLETRNISLEEIFFYSPGYDIGDNYPNHDRTEYSFKSVYPKHTLLLTIVEFELEAPTTDSRCFDSLTIYDDRDNAAVIYVLCGNISTDSSFNTPGDTMYAIFSSNSLYTYKGFNISVVSLSPTTLSSPTSSTAAMTTTLSTSPSQTPTSTTTTPTVPTTSTPTTPIVPTTSTTTTPTAPTTSATTTPTVLTTFTTTTTTVLTTSTTLTPTVPTTSNTTTPTMPSTSNTTVTTAVSSTISDSTAIIVGSVTGSVILITITAVVVYFVVNKAKVRAGLINPEDQAPSN